VQSYTVGILDLQLTSLLNPIKLSSSSFIYLFQATRQ